MPKTCEKKSSDSMSESSKSRSPFTTNDPPTLGRGGKIDMADEITGRPTRARSCRTRQEQLIRAHDEIGEPRGVIEAVEPAFAAYAQSR